MPTELRDAESLDPNEAAEIFIDERSPDEKVTIRDARRAMDHAVMAIFELAFSLESLTDAIGRFKAEAPSELREDEEASTLGIPPQELLLAKEDVVACTNWNAQQTHRVW